MPTANDLLEQLPKFFRTGGQDGLTTAEDARQYLALHVAAIDDLQQRGRANRIFTADLAGTVPSANGSYLEGDVLVDNDTASFWVFVDGEWKLKFRAVGTAGQTGATGPQGEKGKPGNDGKTGEAGPRGQNGEDGRNGEDGKNGNRITAPAVAPGASDGQVGDLAIVAANGDLLEKTTSGWTLRGNLKGVKGDTGATGPQGPAGAAGSGGGSGGASYTLPAATAGALGGIKVGANLAVDPDGTLRATAQPLTLEQNLASNSPTAAPSVAAVKAALDVSVLLSRQPFVVTQTTGRLAMGLYKGATPVFSNLNVDYDTAAFSFRLQYYDANGDTTETGPYAQFGGSSGLNAAVVALPAAVRAAGFAIYGVFTLKAGRSSSIGYYDISGY